MALQRRHNEHDGVSNHKLRVTGLCAGNSPVTCGKNAFLYGTGPQVILQEHIQSPYLPTKHAQTPNTLSDRFVAQRSKFRGGMHSD